MDRALETFILSLKHLSGQKEPEWGPVQELIRARDEKADSLLFSQADQVRREHYGVKVYLRGLIEFTNYCKNNCLYCGIRAGNLGAVRYRLDQETILACCEAGWNLGFRTFVLQGGEDPWYTDDRVCRIVSAVKEKWPDCAVTLSIGEKERSSYQRYFDAGADRYLLRHETASAEHYSMLHPPELRLERRMQCLYDLKEIGFQTGAGFMVGSPGQSAENLTRDLQFLWRLQPDMVGIGPFMPHGQTPFADQPAGTVRDTLVMLSLTRLLLPKTLLPATTALASLHPLGRILALQAGANVVMPNLSPAELRDRYSLYDHKASAGAEAAEGVRLLEEQVKEAGYQTVWNRGDRAGFSRG